MYAVDFRFSDSDPDNQVDIRLGSRQQALVSFDFKKLNEYLLALEMREYGDELTASFFKNHALQTAFNQARAVAENKNAGLRVRLAISASAVELHALRWETLRDPQTQVSLSTNQNVFFSRYLSNLDWRPVRLRAKNKLTALALIAAPSGLEAYQLATVDKTVEMKNIATGLGEIELTTLEHATLNAMVSALSQKEFDILYIVAHGLFANGESYLWLENEQGEIDKVNCNELVMRIRELEHRPRLAVLASCQSAGKGAGDVASALGPRLTEAGIPAVLAMQANLRMYTNEKFMPVFFAELNNDGQIDRALAVARGQVREQPDWWVPALFMRLKSGRLWKTPGFGDPSKGASRLPAIITQIKKQRCTPIIGPGLAEPVLGSLSDIARRWAERFRYPMSAHERDSLPQVAQFLSVNQDEAFPVTELENVLTRNLRTKYRYELPENLLSEQVPLNTLLEFVNNNLLAKKSPDAHRALAELELPIYITTNQDNLLENALSAIGRKPRTLLCPWNESVERKLDQYTEKPSIQEPLVYHLFGSWDQPDSIVLTEDQYFDFLVGVTGNKDIIPDEVRLALSSSSLLFLGFQTHDWNFRVLFRSILARPGSSRRGKYAHVAAQVEPEDDHILEPNGARIYLGEYFGKGNIDIFWGTPQEFLTELLQARQKGE